MKRILVAEDDPMISKTISFKLKKSGFEVVNAKDGKEALEKVAEMHFDLLVTDMMMPIVSGLELVEKIRKTQPKTPILLLSAVGNEDLVLKAFELGADDYVKKPFSPNELMIRVQKLLNK